jgi:hypothetical protein
MRMRVKLRVKLLAFVPVFCCAVSAFGVTYYVDLHSTNATPPFTDWTTAPASIRDAVNTAVSSDIVLATNGVSIADVQRNETYES